MTGRTHVAFLRAVNVGGRGKVAMPALVEVFESVGHTEVQTYLQSGNVAFVPARGTGAGLAEALEHAVARQLGVDARVIVRTRAQLATVAAANPFLASESHLANLHVAFLGTRPATAAVASLDPHRSPPDQLEVVGCEVYLRYPNGSGRTKLNVAYLERMLGTHATARNWNTVTKVLALLG